MAGMEQRSKERKAQLAMLLRKRGWDGWLTDTNANEDVRRCLNESLFCFVFCLFFFFFLFLGPLPRHMEVPRLGGESEL